MTGFGASAPIEALYPHFGITADKVAERRARFCELTDREPGRRKSCRR